MDLDREQARFIGLAAIEEEISKLGYARIAGVDEAGRGPLAGPVVAAACIVPAGFFLPGLDDSKKLSPSKRLTLFREIISYPGIDYGIGVVDPSLIDEINILQATLQAMSMAIETIASPPDFLLVDGLHVPTKKIPGRAIVRGDSLSQSIAAASILAKCVRDQLMEEEAKRWPYYGFARNKGYGTKAHLSAIEKLGPCPIHRKSFEPIKSIVQRER